MQRDSWLFVYSNMFPSMPRINSKSWCHRLVWSPFCSTLHTSDKGIMSDLVCLGRIKTLLYGGLIRVSTTGRPVMMPEIDLLILKQPRTIDLVNYSDFPRTHSSGGFKGRGKSCIYSPSTGYPRTNSSAGLLQPPLSHTYTPPPHSLDASTPRRPHPAS